MKTKTYYKVVKKVFEDKRYKLVSAVSVNKFLRQQYYVKRWVEAQVGGFLVFDYKHSAEMFMMGECRSNTKFVLYECKCEETVKLGYFTYEAVDCSLKGRNEVLKAVDEAWRTTPSGVDIYNFPRDSVAFKRVKLTKKIASKTGYDTAVFYK